MTRLLALSLFAIALTPAARPQEPPAGPAWANPGESDIGLAANAEKDPAKKLALLRRWEQQYPTSAFNDQRTLMTAQALIAVVSGGFGKPDGPALDTAKKAAQQLIEGMDRYFSAAVRALPQVAQLSDAAWRQARAVSEAQAHALLAYIATLHKDDGGAEAEYRKALEAAPTQADFSYRLGAIVLHEMAASQDVTRYSEALYDLARSLAVTGAGALPPAGRTAAEKALRANYSRYHGGEDGVEDLIEQAAGGPFPPAGFHIRSVVDIANAKQQEREAWEKEHPALAFWETIRTALETQDDAFFASLQGVGFPPVGSDAYHGPAMFHAVVVAVRPPKQLLVNVDSAGGDAILQFDGAIEGDIPAGTAIDFKGVVDSWTKDPYTLTIAIQDPKTDVAGLPEGVRFGPAGKAPRQRK